MLNNLVHIQDHQNLALGIITMKNIMFDGHFVGIDKLPDQAHQLGKKNVFMAFPV